MPVVRLSVRINVDPRDVLEFIQDHPKGVTQLDILNEFGLTNVEVNDVLGMLMTKHKVYPWPIKRHRRPAVVWRPRKGKIRRMSAEYLLGKSERKKAKTRIQQHLSQTATTPTNGYVPRKSNERIENGRLIVDMPRDD